MQQSSSLPPALTAVCPATPSATGAVAADELGGIQICVGQIVSSALTGSMPGLLDLTVDVGRYGKRRCLVKWNPGVAPETVVGRKVVVATNPARVTIEEISYDGRVLTVKDGVDGIDFVSPGLLPVPGTLIASFPNDYTVADAALS